MEGEEREDVVGALCRHTARLLKELPGPVRRISVRDGGASLEIEWPRTVVKKGAAGVEPEPVAVEQAAGLDYLRAPMVGTFYLAPAPGAEPFVKEGDAVEPGQQVAIVEAMKLMNPVHATAGGQLLEVLVEDGTAVEYDQPLFAIASAEYAG